MADPVTGIEEQVAKAIGDALIIRVPPRQIAAEVVALVRKDTADKIAEKIAAQYDGRVAKVDLWNQAVDLAAGIAREVGT